MHLHLLPFIRLYLFDTTFLSGPGQAKVRVEELCFSWPLVSAHTPPCWGAVELRVLACGVVGLQTKYAAPPTQFGPNLRMALQHAARYYDKKRISVRIPGLFLRILRNFA